MGTDTAGTGLPWIDAITAAFERHDFVTFHEVELPELVLRNGHLVVADLEGATPVPRDR